MPATKRKRQARYPNPAIFLVAFTIIFVCVAAYLLARNVFGFSRVASLFIGPLFLVAALIALRLLRDNE